MYSAVPAVVPVASAPRRAGLAGGPLLAICCLIFVLFLIAATIVLALIPVYLPNKTVSTSAGSEPYYFTMTPDQPLTGPDGELDDTARTDLGQQIDKAQGFPSGSTNVEEALVRTPAARRKRRTFALQRNRRQTSIRVILVRTRFLPALCGLCIVRATVFNFPFSFMFNGVRVSVTMTAVASSSPPTVSTLAPVTGEVSTTVAGEVTTTTTAAGQTTTTTAEGETTATTAEGETTATTTEGATANLI